LSSAIHKLLATLLSVFFREGPHIAWKIPSSKREGTIPFCKAPSQKGEEGQEGSYLSVRWLFKKIDGAS
jgi:hypothetical protein